MVRKKDKSKATTDGKPTDSGAVSKESTGTNSGASRGKSTVSDAKSVADTGATAKPAEDPKSSNTPKKPTAAERKTPPADSASNRDSRNTPTAQSETVASASSGASPSKAGPPPTAASQTATAEVLDAQPQGPAPSQAPTPDRGPVPVRRVGRRRAAGPSRAPGAANDDVPSIGGLIYALQQKPSRRPFTVAAIMSGVWALGSVLIAWLMLGAETVANTPFMELIARPQTITLLATALLPIAVFWFLAVLVWRAQELRLMSSAMTEVAVRLAEPDRLAEQSVASLGQTVRRQVMSMNDAINRSLGRAGELEALVHNEVAALERAYHDNEVRVRGLINELVSERQSLTNNSDRVSDTIRGIGLEVTQEIATASEIAAKSLSAATTTLSAEVQKSGSQLTARIQATNDQTAYLMSESGNTLLSSLGDMNKRIGVEVPALLDKLSGEQTRLTKIVEGAGRNLAALETALGERVDSLDTSLGEKTETLRDALQTKIKDFDDTFTDKARALDAAIGEKMGQFDNSITDKAKTFYQALEQTNAEIDRTIHQRTQAIETTILERTRAIEASMQRQATQVDGTVAKGIDAVQRSSDNITQQSMRTIDGLTRQGESLRDVSNGLLGQIRDLTDRFDNQAQTIMKAAHALESSNFRMDSVLEHRHSELSGLLDEISNRAEAFDGAMRSYSQTGAPDGNANLRDRFVNASQAVSREMGTLTGRDSMKSSGADAGRSLSELEQTRAQLQREYDQRQRSGDVADDPMQRRLQALEHLAGSTQRDPVTSRPPEPQQRPMAGGGGDRWSLGDLLSRASDDSPLPMVQNGGQNAGQGNSGTVTLDLKNMARAIDMQTATDVWTRLNAGERNLLDRRIYTIDGQVTFDEIGRRYVSDVAFRNTVNRYLTDFEQLLREVDGKDPGGNIVRNHLVSEMGRVYLLLAHASGRLS